MSQHPEASTDMPSGAPECEGDPAVGKPDAGRTEPGREGAADASEKVNDGPVEIEALQTALEQAQAEAAQYRDQALRAQAEMENVRKRAQRDVESARKFALEKFASELLGVRDSLELGLKAAEEHSGDSEKLAEGMEMTRRMLASSMEKAGIEEIDPAGEAFNPDFHEAVSTVPTDDQQPNTVVSVMQKGYTLNGRVLRAAMVTVAKAPGDKA